jgi:hypothetical protein
MVRIRWAATGLFLKESAAPICDVEQGFVDLS